MPGESLRLHRFLAMCGVASRRKAEELILEGRVTVNGDTVTELGTKVSAEDTVLFDGNPVRLQETVTYLMHKPKGVLTTMHDPQGRKTVKEYLPPNAPVVKPVGRLDRETDGLLILTNDGELAMRLTHARYGVEKEYKAIVHGKVEERNADRLRKGIVIDGYRTRPAEIHLLGYDPKQHTTGLKIVLHEGRKRQIRLMADAIGHPVVTLRRVRIGNVLLKGLSPGEVRLLGQKDLKALSSLVGL